MAQFREGEGIILSDEDKEILNNTISSENSKTKKFTRVPKLMQAISDYFVGWEIKEK